MKLYRYAINRLVVVLTVLTLTMTATLVYFLHDMLLAPERVTDVTGPQEGYYWSIAQYQLAYLQLQNEAALQGSDLAHDAAKLRLRLDILQSKYMVLAAPSEISAFFHDIPGYASLLAALGDLMTNLESEVRHVEKNEGHLSTLQRDLSQGWPLTIVLANDIRSMEMRQREAAYFDFHAKRRAIFIVGALLLLLIVATLATLVAAFRRQRVALERERQATEIKHAFLAMVSHELRTPLQSITTAVDSLGEFSIAPLDKLALRCLNGAARQLETQMRDLADYVTLQAGKIEIRIVAFRLRDLLDPVLHYMQKQAAKKCLMLQRPVSVPDGWLKSDPARITQILNNILTNAIKYTERGEVALHVGMNATAPGEERLVLTVEDTGPGIPVNKQAAIFEPFTQLNLSPSSGRDGIGMGLSIVRGLVESLKGEIEVRNGKVDGSVFRISLPVTRSQPPPPSTEQTPLSSSLRVLVVDDTASALESFEILLRRLDITPDTAPSAEDAMQLLRSQKFDVVLLDLDMPVKNGSTLASELRASPGLNQRTPVVAVSAHAIELIPAASKRHFDAFLLKPVRLDTLRITLLTFSRKT